MRLRVWLGQLAFSVQVPALSRVSTSRSPRPAPGEELTPEVIRTCRCRLMEMLQPSGSSGRPTQPKDESAVLIMSLHACTHRRADGRRTPYLLHRVFWWLVRGFECYGHGVVGPLPPARSARPESADLMADQKR